MSMQQPVPDKKLPPTQGAPDQQAPVGPFTPDQQLPPATPSAQGQARMGRPGEEYAEGPMKYADENEEMLFGPTTRPDQPMGTGITTQPRSTPELKRHLPMLLQMANDPTAPQELHDFLSLVQYHMGREG